MGKAIFIHPPKKTIRDFEEVCPPTANKLGTTEHFQEFGFQMLLVHCKTAPLDTYPQDLPGQEILTGIQLLIIHQEVGNPRLQDVEFRRSHVLVFILKTMGEERRHQIRRARCSKAPASREQLYTPNTATAPGVAQIQPKSPRFSAQTPLLREEDGLQVLQHPSRDEGGHQVRLRAFFSNSSHIVYYAPIIIFLCPGLHHHSLNCKKGKGCLFAG